MKRRPSRLWLLVLAFSSCVMRSDAQSSTAPSGYYPPGFYGHIFTGSLQSTRADKQELTLVYAKGKKTEQLVGRLEAMCTWKDKNAVPHSAGVSDLPKGAVLTAYYIPMTRRSGGVTTKDNSIFALSYAEENGRRIPDEKRVVIFCTEQHQLYYKAF